MIKVCMFLYLPFLLVSCMSPSGSSGSPCREIFVDVLVISAETGEPVAGVTVPAYYSPGRYPQGGRLIDRFLTDNEGRFSFSFTAGRLRTQVAFGLIEYARYREVRQDGGLAGDGNDPCRYFYQITVKKSDE